MSPLQLPHVYTCLNILSAILLILGYLAIKKGEREQHKKIMLSAFISSTLFLCLYLFYHFYLVNTTGKGHVPYPWHDLSRTIYFIILIPHIILATLMTPFIIALLIFAFKEKFSLHKKIGRIIWPIWLYVSVTGVIIYLMLYVQPMFRELPPKSPETEEANGNK